MTHSQLIAGARITSQLYGIAMAQGQFGGPRGIWLECTSCTASDVIVGSNGETWSEVPTSDCAKVFRRHGWTGNGETMKRAKCPKCSAVKHNAACNISARLNDE